MSERFVTDLAMRLCVRYGHDCKGRAFGTWQRCPHGLAGRIAELEAEIEPLKAELETADWPEPKVYASDMTLLDEKGQVRDSLR